MGWRKRTRIWKVRKTAIERAARESLAKAPREYPPSLQAEGPVVPLGQRLDHPANAGPRARLLAELQRHHGNAGLQRLIAPHRLEQVPSERDLSWEPAGHTVRRVPVPTLETGGPGGEETSTVTLGAPPVRQGMTFSAWLTTSAGQSYNRLRTALERQGYRFILKVRSPTGAWERRDPAEDTPADQVGWSIGSPDGHWTWATPDSVVGICERLTQIQPVDMGPPIRGAPERFYNITEPVLAQVPRHFQYVDRDGNRWAGETSAQLSGAANLAPVREGGRLVVHNIPWRLIIRVTMPRWQNFLTASDADRREWARFMRCTRIHEQGHVDLANDFLRSIDPQDRQVTGANLREIQENLTYLGDELQATLQDLHDQYDERNGHGATQQAVLRPPGAASP
jgi:hypothetical protein